MFGLWGDMSGESACEFLISAPEEFILETELFSPGTRPQPAYCGRVPGFLKLFSEKCVCVFVCLYVYLFVFPHPREQTFYLNLESSLYTNNKG